ncbi:thiamine phosphate synthase [Spirochaeta thermophila]|uniref:Thiamine-phosphate synthase n=1 Tax=Winmispira thermophila (strain ATCC 49972 / DSM 6192 / RI 19.B1) TaxID=665571 RepID=E0RNC0_WINT6|nr:thiamine phosphate synthase [Spirochaeta thermophila]ADN01120.1 thiamine-phosphate pyrophosphorylase [Spirochaeta thermophila DSM 6192]
MRGLYRMLDANWNRAAEGLRVLEDVARFVWNDGPLAERLKGMRHRVRGVLREREGLMAGARDVEGDVGKGMGVRGDGREGLEGLVRGNCARVEEALRSMEEALRSMGLEREAGVCEEVRYGMYEVEGRLAGWLRRVRVARAFDGGVYAITAEEYSRGRGNLRVMREALEGGARIVQYREKEKSYRAMYEEARALRELCREYGALFVVNDHVELALMVEADGVHVGQDDWPVEEVRRVVGPGMVVGLSTHGPAQAQAAVERGVVDYIGVGPVFPTSTKKDVCAPVGLEYVAYASREVRIPWVAIGGIKEHNLDAVCELGARCVAMVTEIVGAEDVRGKVRRVRERVEGWRGRAPAPRWVREWEAVLARQEAPTDQRRPTGEEEL